MGKTFRIFMLCCITLLLIAGCGDDEKAKAEPERLKVVLAEVEAIKLPLEYTFNAVLAAKETVEVRAKISGYLLERLFEEGSMVKQGDVIYRLDDRDLQASLATAHAQTVKAEASWKNAELTKNRFIPLAKSGSVSAQDRDNAIAKADETFAFYTAAKADEERAAVNLSYATIIAPISGFINRSTVDVGGYVEAGSALLTTIYNIDVIRAEFSITDREYAMFQQSMVENAGDPEAVYFDMYLGDERRKYEHTGAMEMADPIVDHRTNTMGVRVAFPNPEHRLRPGMYVNVIGRSTPIDALAVPEEAVIDHGGGKAVYMVDENNTLKAVPVETGTLTGTRRVVTKGLTAGQKVVVQGLVAASPGMPVEVVPAKRSTKDAGDSSGTENRENENPAGQTQPDPTPTGEAAKAE